MKKQTIKNYLDKHPDEFSFESVMGISEATVEHNDWMFPEDKAWRRQIIYDASIYAWKKSHTKLQLLDALTDFFWPLKEANRFRAEWLKAEGLL